MNIYETKNFLIQYPQYKTREPNLIIEILQQKYYEKIKDKFIELCQKKDIKINKENDSNNKAALLDILSIFIFKRNDDPNYPIFSPKVTYNINDIKGMNINLVPNEIQILNKILKKIGDKIIRYSKIIDKLYNSPSKLSKYQYIFNIEQNNNFINLKFKINNTKKKDIQDYNLGIKKSIIQHLIKRYNLTNYNDYITEKPLDDKFYELVFILYTRYKTLQSGNNQSSILPSLKLLLKKYLNIKVELFGSAINTSNKYCSLFYDIEKYFGSMGNFFNIDIIKGYYSINPPYEDNIINQMFAKLGYWLNRATNNKNPLLFFIILPRRDYKKFNNYNKLTNYIRYIRLVKSNNFPFLRYDRYLARTLVSHIVDVILMIAYNDYIDEIYKKNGSDFNTILNKWILKFMKII
jgi:hypothetical protein